MKRFCFLVSLILCLWPRAAAAASPSRPFEFGFKTGLVVSNTHGDSLSGDFGGVSVSQKSRTGFFGDVFVSCRIAKQLAVQPEIQYVQKGVKFEGSQDLMGSTLTVKGGISIPYVEVPLLLKFLVPASGSTKPSLYAGPAFGFKTSTGLTASADWGGTSVPITSADLDPIRQQIDQSLKKTDVSLAFGGSVDIGHLVFDLRYTLGLTNIIDAGSGATGSIKNTAFQLMAGYRI